MPLFEFKCKDCESISEILVMSAGETPRCPHCKSEKLGKRLSAPAAHPAVPGGSMPGPGDTACCGTSPSESHCAGPGSCCGKGEL